MARSTAAAVGLLVAALLACAAPQPSPASSDAAGADPETTLPTVDFATLTTRESHDMAAAIASTTPSTVTFRVGTPSRVGSRVTLTGLVENTADTPVTLTYFRYGQLGFNMRPPPEAATAKPPPPGGPLLPPPVPPPPMLVDIPAHTAVLVTTSAELDAWDWKQGAARELDWSLLLWNEPKHGRIAVP